jgi:hypothetical protein
MSQVPESADVGRNVFLKHLDAFVRSLGDPGLPESIYHYTSHAGLLGIVKCKSIWATDSSYLNDPSEMSLGFRFTFTEIRRRVHEQRLDEDLGNLLGHYVDVPANEPSFVASFSAARDDLSQWRAYCPDGSGYAIGLSVDDALQMGKSGGPALYEVQYRPEDHLRMANLVLDAAISLKQELWAVDSLTTQQRTDHLVTGFTTFLGIISPMMKDYAFHHEQEWRLVSTFTTMPYSKLNFRVGRRTLIPYISVPLADPKGPLHFKEIVIGPNATKHTPFALKAALAKYGITCYTVASSQSPYQGPV